MVAEKIDIHGYERRLKLVVGRVKSSGLSDANKRALLRFRDQCVVEGLTAARTAKHLNALLKVAGWLGKDFEEAGREDITGIIRKLETGYYYRERKTKLGKVRREKIRFSEWTKHDYKVVLKKFYRWLRGGEDYPEEVKWIKITIKNNNRKLPEELLTGEEVKHLIDAASTLRDKALVSTLYESGCRVGELLSLRLKHVEFDKYGARLIVEGKTGMRRVRVIAASPHLLNWFNNGHPLREDPDAPLWVGIQSSNRNEYLDYASVRKLLVTLCRRAGIRKRVNPHMFRHSRGTHLAKVLTEAQMNQHFGWVQGSDMPAVYVHLSGRDVDDALLRSYGLKEEEGEEKKEGELRPRRCPRCGEINPDGAKFCSKCASVLDLRTALDMERQRESADAIMSRLLEDPEVQGLLKQKIGELKSQNLNSLQKVSPTN